MVAAIPASQIVNVNPGVISAGGTGLDLSGLLLTDSTRVPIGQVLSFPTAAAVGAYFGLSSVEYAEAVIYFGGFANSLTKPGAMLFAQYPTNARGVPAYLRGGSLASMTLAQLQAIPNGTISVTINGSVKTSGTINLSAVASFSAAATAIQTALAAFDAVVTGAIATNTTMAVTASITDTIMTVTAVGGGTIVNGAIIAGTGVTAGTMVQKQLSGTTGGVGTYLVSVAQSVASTAITGSYGVMTVSAVSSGVLGIGQVVSGTGVTVGTTITQFGTGTGGVGTYFVTPSQTASSTTLSCGPELVTYDSTAAAFVITGGTSGPASTIGFASGAMATSLKLTQATGAVTSQGAAQGVPATNMAAVIQQTQNFASFTTTFDPITDDKVAFAAWADGEDERFMYVMWTTAIANTLAPPNNAATAAARIIAAGYSGTFLLYEPINTYKSAFVMGAVAAIDFERLNGRTTLAFRSQSGLTPDVTDGTIAAQLEANGLNFYGLYATSADQFGFLYPGSVTGPYLWADSYVNQIWLNSAFQDALMTLLTQSRSIPYNDAGYTMIAAALADPINDALNFGAIRPGVTLSAAQISEVNGAAGIEIAPTLQTRGWYLQISDASPAVRAARQSPPCTFWYTDGQSVQRISLASLEVQ